MSDRVSVRIVDGPVSDLSPAHCPPDGGAVLRFEGVVRGTEDGGQIEGLDYEVYDPMATRELERLAESIVERHGLLAVEVLHSRGRVAVGECSFHLSVAAPHRAEALAGVEEFIDTMKRDVPIWKTVIVASPASSTSERT